MAAERIYSAHNDEAGLQATVDKVTRQAPRPFRVQMIDVDSDNIVGVVFFPDEEAARTAADRFVWMQ